RTYRDVGQTKSPQQHRRRSVERTTWMNPELRGPQARAGTGKGERGIQRTPSFWPFVTQFVIHVAEFNVPSTSMRTQSARAGPFVLVLILTKGIQPAVDVLPTSL